MREIAVEGCGAIVYLRGHWGRGIGLAHKIRAYALQEEGLDTVDANTAPHRGYRSTRATTASARRSSLISVSGDSD